MTKKQESQLEAALKRALDVAERKWSAKKFLELAFGEAA
tara:strand:+ start:313 stop:429 length:117 start_codon:yes stop_codon:yes gene_type:complete